MQKSFAELTFLDAAVAYQYAFVYVRQYAIHLRNAIIAKRKVLVVLVNETLLMITGSYTNRLQLAVHARTLPVGSGPGQVL